MKILNSLDNKVVKLYSWETENPNSNSEWEYHYDCKILFRGTKSELLEKPQIFWWGILPRANDPRLYKLKNGGSTEFTSLAIQDFFDSIEKEGEYIIITKEISNTKEVK
jgi:hypothetical protein